MTAVYSTVFLLYTITGFVATSRCESVAVVKVSAVILLWEIYIWLIVVQDSFCVRHGMLSVSLLGSVRENIEESFLGFVFPHRNTIQDLVNKTKTGILMKRKPKCHCWVLTELHVWDMDFLYCRICYFVCSCTISNKMKSHPKKISTRHDVCCHELTEDTSYRK